VEVLPSLLDIRRERGFRQTGETVVATPAREHFRRRTKAESVVDHRRSADAGAGVKREPAVHGDADFPELGRHLGLVARELSRLYPGTGFEHDDVEARFSEQGRHGRAARAAAYDDGIGRNSLLGAAHGGASVSQR